MHTPVSQGKSNIRQTNELTRGKKRVPDAVDQLSTGNNTSSGQLTTNGSFFGTSKNSSPVETKSLSCPLVSVCDHKVILPESNINIKIKIYLMLEFSQYLLSSMNSFKLLLFYFLKWHCSG